VDVLQDIKQLKPNSQVIMLSGQDKLEVALDSMKYGAYDYVIKGENSVLQMENILRISMSYTASKCYSTYKKVLPLFSLQ